MGSLSNLWSLVFSFCVVTSVVAQEEPIPWSPDRKLQWSDFKGTHFKTEWAAATTASGISYSFSSYEKEGQWYLDLLVTCEFYPDKSWYQPELCDSAILGHEQLHFDISEFFARKMRQRLSKSKFTKNVKAEVRSIYKEVLKELSYFQNKYDHETNFSRNPEKQNEWNKRIAKALLETDSGYNVN